MDFTAPISSIMTRKLFTVSAEDNISAVNEIFNKHHIHHVLVVRYTQLVGIISKTDLAQRMKGTDSMACSMLNEFPRLHQIKAGDMMTTCLATLESTDRINVALQVFSENLFHAIPVVDDGEIVGILTTYDIIKALQKEDVARMLAN